MPANPSLCLNVNLGPRVLHPGTRATSRWRRWRRRNSSGRRTTSGWANYSTGWRRNSPHLSQIKTSKPNRNQRIFFSSYQSYIEDKVDISNQSSQVWWWLKPEAEIDKNIKIKSWSTYILKDSCTYPIYYSRHFQYLSSILYILHYSKYLSLILYITLHKEGQ